MVLIRMDQLKRKAVIVAALNLISVALSCNIPKSERFECGQDIESREVCENQNCCYDEGTTPKCYFPTKDAAGGPIQHSNGLCMYPKDAQTDENTPLIWSSNCSSQNAVFLVMRESGGYHVTSGGCIYPKNHKPTNPGDSGELILARKCNYLGYRRVVTNGALEFYYNKASVEVCLESDSPEKGNPVKLSKSACEVTSCDYLTYVFQEMMEKEDNRIECPQNFTIRVTWAFFSTTSISFSTSSGECGKTATKILQLKCNGRKSCNFLSGELNRPSCTSSGKLVTRFTCKRNSMPAALTNVTITVLGRKRIEVRWSYDDSKTSSDEYRMDRYDVCWKTDKKYGNCMQVSESSRHHAVLNKLEPKTKYHINIAAHSCNGRVGSYSRTITVITRTDALKRTSNSVASDSFQIFIHRKLEKDDRFIQIVVRKQVSGAKPQEFYSPNDLRPYRGKPPETYPYIAAELNRNDVFRSEVFTVGDGKVYSRNGKRKKRETAFENVKLEPETYYSVFQRTFKDNDLYYDSDWMEPVITDRDRSDKNGNSPTVGQDTTSGGEDGVVTGAAVGGTLAIILVVVLIVLTVFMRRRNRAKNNTNDQSTDPVYYETATIQDNDVDNQHELVREGPATDTERPTITHVQSASGDLYARPQKIRKNENIGTKDNAYSNIQGESSCDNDHKDDEDDDFLSDFDDEEEGIEVSRFLMHVEDMKKDNNAGFDVEFKKLPCGQLYPWDIAKKSVNEEKNRYGNIVTYDHSRVVLSGEDGEDYINASLIVGVKPDVYIASQGPTTKTVNDFWRMIWEQNCNSIIALTKIVELGKIKCCQYWPDGPGRLFGKIEVTTLNTELFADYAIRRLLIKKDGENKKVTQYQFTSWPDHGVPKYPTQLLAFRERFKSWHHGSTEPIVIHCSAGVGRTGAFIALDTVLQRLHQLHEQTIDVYDVVEELRTHRINMVQTLEQYIFVHDAVLESILCGVTEIEARSLKTEFERLEQRERKKSLTGFELQFKKFNSICPSFSSAECEEALRKENQSKNRNPEIYPCESFRVALSPLYGNSTSTYINATFVDGYTKPQAYIATQTPLPETVNDFWRMVYEQKAIAIVMLNDLSEGQMVYPQYWPNEDDQGTQYGNLVVKLTSSHTNGTIISRMFSIHSENQESSSEHMVRHLQFVGWSEDAVPSKISDILTFLEIVEEAQRYSADGVIIVHCSNGAHRTGTFLTLVMQRERIRSEHVVDIFKCIKILRGQCPQFVGNVEQYRFCYQVILGYVDSFETYENIPNQSDIRR